ncbi:hypothetical protein AMTR_s00002p00248240 [Amborella trichopoda]|uniref:cytokinin dehydrogenase n=2 Tax=Amborella trichopoda TaxID=13333 RepID=W1NUG7_AMBTC|nr:hypothetical protein AMTR_s00002p00248240 [Amborella trichopoda]
MGLTPQATKPGDERATFLPNYMASNLSFDASRTRLASRDFGGLTGAPPHGVLVPSSVHEIANLVRVAYEADAHFRVAAKGHAHSIQGQAQAPGGVVIEMEALKGCLFNVGVLENESCSFSSSYSVERESVERESGGSLYYADVWGGELWIDVLHETLKHGLAPRSWTDYLYLTVGGTLSNAGISGQAFNHGPQISNVYELDVVTGKGELLTCSKHQNSELFHSVLGGLGQFGIITRARIALEPAPQRVRWIRVLYSDFNTFTRDQEHLISLHGRTKFDYVEGFVIVDEGLINNWRSSFFSPRNPIKLQSIVSGSKGTVLYCLEVTKNYDEATADTVDQEVDSLLKTLSFIQGSVFTTDLPYIDFLDRVHKAELKLRAKGLWDVPHPWLNLFIPKSKIADFDAGVFKGILGKKTSGPILIYPMNKNRWDEKTSAVTPDEDVFYLVAFLRSALDNGEETQSLRYLQDQNERILRFCEEANIEMKQYLPHHTKRAQWVQHYGPKWAEFEERKATFDPKNILAPGQRIFSAAQPIILPSASSS